MHTHKHNPSLINIILEMANDHFNNQKSSNFSLVGGILSPVSDAYGKSSLIAAKDRIEMCRLACEGHPLITVETWEALKPQWTPTLEVLNHFKEEIQSYFPKVRLMLLAGSDLVEGFKHEHIWNPQSLKDLIKDFGIVAIERSTINLSSEIFNSNLLYSLRENIEIIYQPVQSELSSSKLRLLIRRGFSIKYLTSDNVINYIKENNLYQ